MINNSKHDIRIGSLQQYHDRGKKVSTCDLEGNFHKVDTSQHIQLSDKPLEDQVHYTHYHNVDRELRLNQVDFEHYKHIWLEFVLGSFYLVFENEKDDRT